MKARRSAFALLQRGLRLVAQGCRLGRLPWEKRTIESFNRKRGCACFVDFSMQMTQPRCGRELFPSLLPNVAKAATLG